MVTYTNGSYTVSLDLETGTKVREWSEPATPPEFPESMDLKITDYCDAGCAWCHEQSTKRGKHGNLSDILRMVEGLPAGVELAIGGGNPFSHPDLLTILTEFKALGLVSNVTINMRHVAEFADEIQSYRKHGLLYGLGVSYHRDTLKANPRPIRNVWDSKTVLHVIAGLDPILELSREVPTSWKLLVLGFKDFGFGSKFKTHQPVKQRLGEWRYWIGTLMRNYRVSFDNLGLSQLNVRDWITPECWDGWFMGEDGTFTMYVDAVKMEFAQGSTATRIPIAGRNIRQCFKEIRDDK